MAVKINDPMYVIRKVAINLFLDDFEKSKFLEIYNNSDPVTRDVVLLDLERQSQSKDYFVRRNLKDQIRNS